MAHIEPFRIYIDTSVLRVLTELWSAAGDALAVVGVICDMRIDDGVVNVEYSSSAINVVEVPVLGAATFSGVSAGSCRFRASLTSSLAQP